MSKTITKYHSVNASGESVYCEAATYHFSPGSEELTNEVCLTNSCYDDTGFEPVPANVGKWIEQIGMDFSHFPNLTRLWGDNRSIYALTLRYEIAHGQGEDAYGVAVLHEHDTDMALINYLGGGCPCVIDLEHGSDDIEKILLGYVKTMRLTEEQDLSGNEIFVYIAEEAYSVKTHTLDRAFEPTPNALLCVVCSA